MEMFNQETSGLLNQNSSEILSMRRDEVDLEEDKMIGGNQVQFSRTIDNSKQPKTESMKEGAQTEGDMTPIGY